MELWSILSKDAWEVLQNKSTLKMEDHLLNFDFKSFDWSWEMAYNWLSSQMEKRINKSPENIRYPIWAWCKKPDLRSNSYLPKNVEGARVKFETEEGRALLSDFDAWHFALNYWFLPISKVEEDLFENRLKKKNVSFYKQKPILIHSFHKQIMKSWENMFEPKKLNYAIGPLKDRTIQATIWELRKDQIKEVSFFCGR